MKKKKCNCKEFCEVEEYFLKGDLIDNILYIKTTGDSNGMKNIKCVECGEEIDSNIEIELCC